MQIYIFVLIKTCSKWCRTVRAFHSFQLLRSQSGFSFLIFIFTFSTAQETLKFLTWWIFWKDYTSTTDKFFHLTYCHIKKWGSWLWPASANEPLQASENTLIRQSWLPYEPLRIVTGSWSPKNSDKCFCTASIWLSIWVVEFWWQQHWQFGRVETDPNIVWQKILTKKKNLTWCKDFCFLIADILFYYYYLLR